MYKDIETNDLVDLAGEEEELPGDIPPEQNPKMTVDKLGRKHFRRPTYGPAVLKLRAVKFGGSSATTHSNDMLPILSAQVKDGKTIAFIKVDNGPDWSLLNVTNELYFSRLWRDSGLDILGIISYAAQWSAYNNIEHLWSPQSRKLCKIFFLYSSYRIGDCID